MTEVDHQTLKDRARRMWSAGEYAEIAKLTWPAAEAVVDLCAISAGQEVLDVAAGTGNLAVAAAREGAAVVASDLTPELVEQGRARTEQEGLDVAWDVADAEQLPYEDGRFDCAASVFGAMFAPRPERVAAELFRVVRPGGTVGFVAWAADGHQARSFEITYRYLPPPEGLALPTEWGHEHVVRERFEPHAATLDFHRRRARFEFSSLEAMADFFERNAPPLVVARKALGERYADLRDDQMRLAAEDNQATDGSVLLEPEYLVAVARRRG